MASDSNKLDQFDGVLLGLLALAAFVGSVLYSFNNDKKLQTRIEQLEQQVKVVDE